MELFWINLTILVISYNLITFNNPIIFDNNLYEQKLRNVLK